MKQKLKLQSIYSVNVGMAIDISEAANKAFYLLEHEANKENRDEYTVAVLISICKLLPNYRPELQKYF
jgi:hypothetical protein